MNRYFLAHNSIDIFEYSILMEGQIVTTGQPELEYFDTEQALINRLVELGQDYIPKVSF